jgi:saccharopine dehydrogenase-like NADP-dependent oxidoreductase
MKILVVGCGKVGSEIARDLAGSDEVDSVAAMDASSQNLRLLRKRVSKKVETVRMSISQKPRFHALLGKVDLVCGALPGRLGFDLMTETVKAGKDTVDISYTPKDPFQLQAKAKEVGCRVVPQCGVAPGFTNMCVGDASRRLDQMKSVEVYVGGLPEKPEPPLNYRIVFSLEDVVNEYSRPVQVIEERTRKKVEALPEDFLALRVDVKGLSRGKKLRLRYQLLNHYNRKSGVSAMARTTAYPCTSVALLMGRGEIKETGVVTPEKIAQDPRLFQFVLDRLADRGVKMKLTMPN